MSLIKSITSKASLFFVWAGEPAFLQALASPADAAVMFPPASGGVQKTTTSDASGAPKDYTSHNGKSLKDMTAAELNDALDKAFEYEASATKNVNAAQAMINEPVSTEAKRKMYTKYLGVYKAQQAKRSSDRADIATELVSRG